MNGRAVGEDEWSIFGAVRGVESGGAERGGGVGVAAGEVGNGRGNVGPSLGWERWVLREGLGEQDREVDGGELVVDDEAKEDGVEAIEENDGRVGCHGAEWMDDGVWVGFLLSGLGSQLMQIMRVATEWVVEVKFVVEVGVTLAIAMLGWAWFSGYGLVWLARRVGIVLTPLWLLGFFFFFFLIVGRRFNGCRVDVDRNGCCETEWAWTSLWRRRRRAQRFARVCT